MSGFLDKWLGKPHVKNWRNLSRVTIKHDKWDMQDLEQIMKVMPDFGHARDLLCDNVETGNGATTDTFFGFFKWDARPEDPEKIRPDYLINAMVRDELQGMTEWDELRALGTIGDDVNSALAFVTMREDLETLFDKLKKEQELANQLSQQLQELQQLEAEAKSIEQLLEEMEAQDEPDQEAVDDLKAKQDANAQQQADLEGGVQTAGEALKQGLADKRGQIQQTLRKGLDKAKDEARTMEGIDQTWGTEPGAVQRLSADKRLDLAKKIKDRPKLKRLSQLVGPMKRVMFGEIRKKAEHARDEVFNVEKGDDVGRLVPQELVYLHHPKLKKLFYRNLADQALLQYELKGQERLGLGGIVCAIDNSGSMAGDREIWAKAVGLSLLHLAKQQKRSFKGIHFGSAREIQEFDFVKPEDFSIERIFEFAELFFNGGTDFQVPLTAAVKHLRGEFTRTGKVKGDVVFITDGYCGVSEAWFEGFKKEQAELGFQVFGVLIGSEAWSRTDVLDRICDGKIVTIKNLTSPDDVRDVFGKLNTF